MVTWAGTARRGGVSLTARRRAPRNSPACLAGDVRERFFPLDEHFMRLALREAERALEHDDVPVGAVIVSEGEVVAGAHNERELRQDPSAHAEMLAIREAARALASWRLLDCVLYVTLEPCAMCAGAIYWAGIGRVVFGQTEKALKAQTGAHEENPTLDLPCAVVFAAGQRPTEVVGPLLEDEAAQLQADFWKTRG